MITFFALMMFPHSQSSSNTTIYYTIVYLDIYYITIAFVSRAVGERIRGLKKRIVVGVRGYSKTDREGQRKV